MMTAPESDRDAEVERNAPGSVNRRAVLLLVAMLLVVLIVPALFGRPRTVEPFDQSALDRFESAAPEIVFLGNSLLETRIDPGYLAELTGRRIVSLAIDGTGPGIWFLQLNDLIGESVNRPDKVFIFFHDDLITRPISFTGPEDRKLVERLTHVNYREFRYDLARPKSIGEWLRILWLAVYPLADSPSSGSGSPIAAIGARIAGMSRNTASDDAERFFAFANKREQAVNIQQPKFHGSFDSRIRNSFLPTLIQRADMLDIDLVIVRVSARPNDDGTPNEPDTLAKYSSELSDYLASREIRYIDMSGHPGIDAGMYYDGYHLKHRFRTYYTEIFGDWLLSDGGAHP